MGLVILPLIVVAIGIGVLSFFKLLPKFKHQEIEFKEMALGALTSIGTFLAICTLLVLQGKATPFSPLIWISLVMFIIPFTVIHSARNNMQPKIIKLSNILLVSIVFTLLFCSIFYHTIFNLVPILGIETQV